MWTPTLLLLPLALAKNPFQDAFPAEAIERFTFTQSAGAVLFKVDPNAGRLLVNGEPDNWDEQGCGIDMGQREEQAWLKLLTEHAGIIRPCRANWDITIPPGVDLVIDFANGDVAMTGDYRGDLQITVGSGDFTFDSASGALNITVGSGQVEGAYTGTDIAIQAGSGGVHLSQMVTPVDVELGLGNIELTYATAPQGDLELRTGTGAITVRLPPASPVNVDLNGVGPKRVKLPKSASAPTRIKASTGVGKIAIEATPPPAPAERE